METLPITAVSSCRVYFLVAAAVVLAGFVAYSNSFRNDFVWDDASSIQINEHVKNPSFLLQLFREDQHKFGRGQGNFYRPLLATSFMLDYQLAAKEGDKISPLIFHIDSTLWHIAASLLLLALLIRVRAPLFVLAAVPLLYAVHPLHSEAVTYISGRGDSMAATFLFAALWFSLWDDSARRRVIGIIAGALCFIAALLSKESATIYPVLLGICIFVAPAVYAERRQTYLSRLVPLAISLVLLIIYAALRMTVLHFASSNPPDITLGRQLMQMFQAFAWYLWLTFVPMGLHMERSLDQTPVWVAVFGAMLLAVVVAAIIHSIGSKHYRAAAAGGWFLASWLPISGLFPLNAPMAEHWMYVPLAGLLWLLAEYAWTYLPHVRARYALAGFVAIACFALIGTTAHRNRDWRDNETIFRATLAQNPNSARVNYNLAVTYEDLQGNLSGARRHYERVVDLYKDQKARHQGVSEAEKFWDDELEAHLALGNILLKDQNYAAAADHFKVPLQIRADEQHRDVVARAAAGMGECVAAAGNLQRAMDLFKKAIEMNPGLRSQISQSRLFASDTMF